MIIDTKYIFLLIFIIFIKICFFKDNPLTNSIKVKLVTTDEDKKTGLMFRKHLNQDEGMLFKFEQGLNSVWMKNTYIPLDVLFLDKRFKVIGFSENTVPLSLDSIGIETPSDYILEVNGGWIENNNIKIGNQIDLEYINELSD
tara:strand:- start:763 stop:1191 length:429 start_codon:yes stop_codon:yes gene_type:complete